MSSIVYRVGREYERAWKASPMLTLAAVNGLLAVRLAPSYTSPSQADASLVRGRQVVGDAAAQVLPMMLAGDPSGAFDLSRTFRYWLFGTLMGPVGGQWNAFLEHRFPLHPPSSSSTLPSAEKEKLSLSEKRDSSHSQYPPPPKSHIIGMSSNSPSNVSPSKTYSKGSGTPFGSPRMLTGGGGGEKKAGPGSLEANTIGEARPSNVAVLKRLASDQLFMAPLSLIVFFSYMAFMEGLDYASFTDRVGRLYFKLLRANWQVWPLVQLFNFRYMPLRFRVPFGAACGVLWTVFISFATRPVSLVPVASVPAPTPFIKGG